MKACVLEAIGKLVYKDVPLPRLDRNEVLLQVKACGICSSDIDRVFKTGTYHFPTIPGHEFSGQIVEVGDGVDVGLLGKKAAVFPLLPCFKCPSCEIGAYARCQQYSYFGSRCDGAFAEYIAVPVWNLVLCPEKVSFDMAAMCEPTAVAMHAVNTAGIKLGDTVAVIGNGTIGLLAAMCAKINGAGKVIIVGRTEKKLEFAKKLGFINTVSTLESNVLNKIQELTNGVGADIALEMVGNSQSIEVTVACAKRGGTVVLTGNPQGAIEMKREIYWKILRNELRLLGTWNSSYNLVENNWHNALHYMETGQLPVEKLITHHFSLDEHEKAFNLLQDRDKLAVKVMFEINR